MAKFTKAQRKEIEDVYRYVRRAFEYVSAPNIAIARRSDMATTTLHYVRPDGSALYEVNKEYGSDLVALWDAKKRLENLLSQA